MSTLMWVVQAPIFVAPIPGYSGKIEGTIEGHDPNTWRAVTIYVEGEGQTSQSGRDMQALRSRRTANNQWVFEALDETKKYTVIAWDYTNTFDPAIKVGLIPEPM